MKLQIRSGTAGAIVFLLAGATCVQAADDLVCTQCVNTSDVADSAISAAKLRSESVTSAKIAAEA